MTAGPSTRPAVSRWQHYGPIGRGAAVELLAGIAAPLLAGFSLALLGVVAQAPQNFRWHALSLVLLGAAAIALVFCVQLAFRARSFMYSRDDVLGWLDWDRLPAVEQEARLLEQASLFRHGLKWERAARGLYNAAVVVLMLGLATVVAPPSGAGVDPPLSPAASATRWTGSAMFLAAAVAEVLWVLVDAGRPSRRAPGRSGHG